MPPLNPDRDPVPGSSRPRDAVRTPVVPPAPAEGRPGGESFRGATTPFAIATERGRLEALVELLDDDSSSVHAMARKTLETAGPLTDSALRRAMRDPRARVRGRARAIHSRRREQGVVRRLLRHATRPEIDLESALFLLGRLQNPDLDARPYRRTLDAMAREVMRRTAREEDGLSRAMVLTQYLGNELGFIGSEVDFDHPDHIHLHRVLETKRGMPLALTAVYLFVARRSGIRAAAIPMPGRVLLRLFARRRSLIVDPFQGGRLRTRTDCVNYLAEHGLVPRPEWFRDADDAILFERHVRNLMSSAQLRGRHRLAHELARVAWLVQRTQGAKDAAAPTC